MTEITYEKQYEPIVIGKPLIDILLKQEKSSDLIALYIFYYYTGKWQETNKVKATRSYVQEGLNWTDPRFSNAKRKLKELGLIEDYQTRDEKTKFITGHYIKVNFMWKKEKTSKFSASESVPISNFSRTRRSEKPGGIKSYPLEKNTPNALSNNNTNALNNNKELYIDFLEKWNSQKIIIHRKLTTKIKTSIKSLLRDYSEKEIFKSIENYSFVIKSNNHYFNHKWTLKDFLKRGVEKFLDEADPLNNFKSNNNQSTFKNPLPETTEKIMKMDIWPKGHEFDEQRLARGLVELKEFSDNLIRDEYGKRHRYYGTLDLLTKEYTDWMYRQDWIDINEGIIGTKNGVFKKFIEAQEKEIGIKIKSKGWGR